VFSLGNFVCQSDLFPDLIATPPKSFHQAFQKLISGKSDFSDSSSSSRQPPPPFQSYQFHTAEPPRSHLRLLLCPTWSRLASPGHLQIMKEQLVILLNLLSPTCPIARRAPLVSWSFLWHPKFPVLCLALLPFVRVRLLRSDDIRDAQCR
jgi:hypothetical protein